MVTRKHVPGNNPGCIDEIMNFASRAITNHHNPYPGARRVLTKCLYILIGRSRSPGNNFGYWLPQGIKSPLGRQGMISTAIDESCTSKERENVYNRQLHLCTQYL